MKLRSLIKIQQDFILANFVVDLLINLPNNKTSKPFCWSKDRNHILTFPLLLLCFRYCSVFKVQFPSKIYRLGFAPIRYFFFGLPFFFHQKEKKVVEMRRIELLAPCLQGRCSPSWATPPFFQQGSEAIPSLFSPFLKVHLFRKLVPSKLNNDLLTILIDLSLWTYLSKFMSP